MKICIAQTQAVKGKVSVNIENHFQLIKKALTLDADLVVFPELSVTGYEPSLAKKLATTIENIIFNKFQLMSDTHDISIVIGMPMNTAQGVHISMFIFQPNKKRTVYSKQQLHSDELPYFVCGNQQTFLNIKGKKIALGICYETLNRKHFLNVTLQDADIYIASVAKSNVGIQKAYSHFEKMATEFKMPILLCNSIGYCDNFWSVGQSAVWNNTGALIGQLDSDNEGVLNFDTLLETCQLI